MTKTETKSSKKDLNKYPFIASISSGLAILFLILVFSLKLDEGLLGYLIVIALSGVSAFAVYKVYSSKNKSKLYAFGQSVPIVIAALVVYFMVDFAVNF